METKEIIEFFNKFPAVKAELVAPTSIRICSMAYVGYVVYETKTAALDLENLRTESTTAKRIQELNYKYAQGGIAPLALVASIFDDDLINAVLCALRAPF